MAVEDNESLVSIILPIYNAERYLDQAIKSAQDQAYRNIEIICVNDGSTDGSLSIIKRHAEADSRIKVIDKENQGYGASMNRGIEESQGKWIAILEPDDWIEPGMLRDMLVFAAQFDEEVDIVKTPYWRIKNADTPQQRKLNCPYRLRVKQSKKPGTIHDIIPVFHNHPSIWSAIYRRDFLDENGIRFMPIPGSGWSDNPFLAETLCRAKRILYYDRPYYCYREGTDEESIRFHKNNPLIPFERWEQMLDIIEETGMDTDDILMAHYSRGFMYMSGVIEQVPLESNPDVMSATKHMFARMKPELVEAYPRISPGCRRLYAELRGMPAPKINHLQYIGNLVEQTIVNTRTIGLAPTLEGIGHYLSAYKNRTGGR